MTRSRPWIRRRDGNRCCRRCCRRGTCWSCLSLSPTFTATAGRTWFVDGGVLDNKPFGPAVDAIRERPADVEVDRRLLYLEPDPGEERTASRQSAPGTAAAAIGGLTGLPRAEPILDDLVEIGALNERVRRIRDIIETSWSTVEARVRELAGPLPHIPDDASDPALADLRKRLEEEAR